MTQSPLTGKARLTVPHANPQVATRRIAVLLGVAFSILVGLLMGVGHLGLRRMDQTNAQLEEILVKRWSKLQLARQALIYSNQNSRISLQIFLVKDDDEVTSLLENRAENTKKISELLGEIQKQCDCPEEKRLLGRIEESRVLYVGDYLRALHLLVEEHDRDQAAAIMTKETAQDLLRYHAAWDDFMHFEMERVDIAAKQSSIHYASARRLALVMIVASVCLASTIALFVIRKIIREMRSRLKAEREINTLNAELEERVILRTQQLELTNKQLASEVEERKRAESEIQFLAYYDTLTGLPNRALFRDRLSIAMASARRRGERVALLYLDLDNFKCINDSLGHTTGDFLLREVAKRLRQSTREQDTVGRLGGDEFVVVLNAVREVADVKVVAERIVKDISKESVLEDKTFVVTCSLGISIFPDDDRDPAELIKNADVAMYCAKESGRNSMQFFKREMKLRALEKSTLENNLRRALENNELFLLYQPQVALSSGNVIGAEALLRWRHSELGVVPPDKFIPIAENTGLIVPIGEWVLRTACRQAQQWIEEGLPLQSISVNVSPIQFRQRDFPQIVRKALDETGLPASYLDLELTEGLIISSGEVALSVFHDLKEMGVQLSIDDFGTGYSNLSYLRRFPVHKLKIDRSFVRDLSSNPDDASITCTIISMARNLNLKVNAEGVESEEQLSFLREHGCDEFQGYYFSKPLAAEDFPERMRHPCLALPVC